MRSIVAYSSGILTIFTGFGALLLSSHMGDFAMLDRGLGWCLVALGIAFALYGALDRRSL